MAIIAKAEVTSGRSSEGGHWYTRAGTPAYEIRGKNGSMRAVTLRDARTLNLVPSVSGIVRMEAAPALVRWQVEQALMAAITLPRNAGESDDAFKERALADSQQQAEKARERGTQIHATLQSYFEGSPIDAKDWPYVSTVIEWLTQRYGGAHWESERSFAHSLGYGGKLDLSCRALPAVTDFKCKDFGPDKQALALAYPEHGMQLAAYGRGLGWSKFDALNIFVSTRVPGLIRVREWDHEELEQHWEAFQCLLKLWKIRKGYDAAFMTEAA